MKRVRREKAERIEFAAIRDHDGKVYWVERPGRHGDVIRLMVNVGRPIPINGKQGFVTDRGRFVDRQEACRLALACGQIDKPKFQPNTLFSEDVW